MADAQQTTDHDTIRSWAEERDGRPATVKGTHPGGEAGVLTIHFPDVDTGGEEDLEDISWNDWFDKFEQEGLAFLHQDETADGSTSRFFKVVSR